MVVSLFLLLYVVTPVTNWKEYGIIERGQDSERWILSEKYCAETSSELRKFLFKTIVIEGKEGLNSTDTKAGRVLGSCVSWLKSTGGH